MLGYTIASMVIAKLCSNDYDFKGKGRATPKATSAASSTEPQVFAVPQGPVRTTVSIIPKATSPGCATAKATNTAKAKTTGPPPAAASLCEFPASSSTSGSSSSPSTPYTDSTMSSERETVKLPKLSDADKANCNRSGVVNGVHRAQSHVLLLKSDGVSHDVA
ncbi:hypothetical protein MBANPS3_010639 [Mucor bainieri]